MPEPTLGQLIAELESLDLTKQTRRFHDIVAELANHEADIPGGLVALSRSLSYQKRCAAVIAVARIKRAELAVILCALLGDAHPIVRAHAARAGNDWPVPEAFQALCGVLGDGVAEVAMAAAAAIAKAGDARGLAPLIRAGLDERTDVRAAAVNALAALLERLGPAASEALLPVPDAAFRPLIARLGDRAEEKKVKEALERRAALTADPTDLEDFGKPLGPDAEAAHEREALVDELVARVHQPGAKSFVLAGDPGVGKTHVIHALAARLAAETPPWVVLETSTSEVMVGTRYIGEWETRLGELINKSRAPRRVLIYFTNVAELAGAGTTSKNDASFLSMLAPHLRRGDVTVVGEASAQALQRGLERAGQKGLFQIIRVAEPEPAALLRTLGKKIETVARKAGVEILVPQPVLDLLVGLAGTYYPGLAEPGRSARLLGEVLAPILEAHPGEPVEVRGDDVIAALARSSGLPARLLDDHRPLDPKEVRAFFEERVVGQPEATSAMVDLITLIKAGLTDPGKPLGVLFFVGPTGVGKTEIARALAEYIYGSPERMLRLDLSEYKDYDSYEKLIGGRGTRDHGATLAGRIRERPFSVVLLDEIEKAHPNVFDLFLQVFDDGRLTDAHGERADFRQAILIMTSNLGSASEGGGLGFGAGASDVPGEERVLKEVRRFFRPEFVNRIGKVVVFKPLSGDTMRTLVRRELGKVLVRGGILRRALRVDIDPAVVDLLLEQGFSVEMGARPLKRRVERLVLTPLARAIVGLTPDDRGALLGVTVEDGHVAVRRRGSRAAPPPAERLRLKRPEDERLLSVKPADVPAMLEALEGRVGILASRAEADGLPGKKSEIVAATASPSFWDDAARARRQLAEMVHLEDLLEGLSRARRRLDDLKGLARSYARHANLRARFEQAQADFVDDLLEIEHRFFGERPEDRRDAFVAVRTIGAGREAAEAAELVGRMYQSWAERRGFALTWIAGRELCLVEGRSLFGLLRGEEGLHRFEGEGKGAERHAAFARVEVSARPDGDSGLARREARIDRGSQGTAAVHLQTGVTVDCAAGVSDELCLELLAAEVEARARRKAAAREEDRVVRRYNVEGRFAVDEDTGIRLGHKELFAGGLDEILRARLYGSGPA